MAHKTAPGEASMYIYIWKIGSSMASLWRTFLSTFIFKSVVSFIHSHVILNLYEFIYLMESKWKDNQTQMFEPIDFHCMDKMVTGLERYKSYKEQIITFFMFGWTIPLNSFDF